MSIFLSIYDSMLCIEDIKKIRQENVIFSKKMFSRLLACYIGCARDVNNYLEKSQNPIPEMDTRG